MSNTPESDHHYKISEKYPGITLTKGGETVDFGRRAVKSAMRVALGDEPLPQLEPEDNKGYTFVHPDGSFDTGTRAVLNGFRSLRGEDPKVYKRTYVRVNHEQPEGEESESIENEDEFASQVLDQSIVNALDGYAKDSETWTAARDLFYDQLKSGESISDALSSALESSKDGAESTADQARLRFDFELPLTAALDGYAKDGETWTAARDAFYSDYEKGSIEDYALNAALILAEDGSESYPESARDRFKAVRIALGKGAKQVRKS